VIEQDYHFKSDSDAELLAHLIDASCQSDPVQALHRALGLVQGQVCVGVLFHEHPERVFAVRRGGDLHAAASPGLLAWSSHPAALPAGLQALPVWPDGQVLEVHVHPYGVTTSCTAEAFDGVHQLIQTRLAELPSQTDPKINSKIASFFQNKATSPMPSHRTEVNAASNVSRHNNRHTSGLTARISEITKGTIHGSKHLKQLGAISPCSLAPAYQAAGGSR
jgi:glucosamine 6-phosphate synthetase-like amidotransferase/phosphosugar isomerase protein